MGILRFLAMVAAVGVAAVAAIAMTELGTAETATAGYRSIVNLNSLKCLDVTGMSKNVGAAVHQWRCTHGKASQSWRLVGALSYPGGYQLRNDRSRKCVGAAATAAAAAVRQRACADGRKASGAAFWQLAETGWPGFYQLRLLGGDQCLDVAADSRKNGANMALGPCEDTANRDPSAAEQAWLVWPV